MIFIILLILAAAALASAAGFFSVFGLMQIFAASATSIMIMGIGLEYSKLVTASLLYRYWKKLIWPLRLFLLCAVTTLMVLTSVGVFGYLTAAYQQDSVPMTQASQQIDSDKAELQRDITRKQQIDQQIANLPNNSVTARKRLMASFNDEYKTLQPNIDRLNAEITKLQTGQVTTQAKMGPIIYVAKVLNADPDKVIFYLVILIVAVFDPLAVALTVSTNIVMEDRKKQREELKAKSLEAEKPEPAIILPDSTPEFAPKSDNKFDLVYEAEEDDVSNNEQESVKEPSKREEILNRIRKEISEASKTS
jgi:hypothetical protein